MIKKEAKWQTIFGQYIREKRIHCYYELKQTNLKYFPFSKIEKVQYEGLQATEKEGLAWKLSDEDQRQKPCDGFCTPPLPSYLVIKFPDAFYMIRFKDIIAMNDAGKTSISREKCEEIAEKVIHL